MKNSKLRIFHLLWLAIVSLIFGLTFLRKAAEPFLFGIPSALWVGISGSVLLLILVVFAALRVKDVEDV